MGDSRHFKRAAITSGLPPMPDVSRAANHTKRVLSPTVAGRGNFRAPWPHAPQFRVPPARVPPPLVLLLPSTNRSWRAVDHRTKMTLYSAIRSGGKSSAVTTSVRLNAVVWGGESLLSGGLR